jgi:hypothetical protein
MAEKQKGAFWRWLARPEAIIGLCAVVVSVIAVFVSAYETAIMRDWQRAAVWPFVQLSRSYYTAEAGASAEGRRWILTFNAENVGVGPAQIRDFRVTVDGKPQANWEAAIQALLATEEDIDYGQSTINGAILPAERMYEMFQLHDSDLAVKIAEVMETRLDFEACYCSVFDECWRTSYRSGFDGAQKTKSCERGEGSFEQ